MATVEQVTMSDDLDENVTEGVQTATFWHPLSGSELEIDLGPENYQALSEALATLERFTAVARVVEAPKPAKPAKGDDRNKEIRAWAQANGFKIGDRGRIKADIVAAFEAAQSKPADEVDCPDGKVGCEVLHLAPEQESVTDGVVDADDLVEVESPQVDTKSRPATEAELQEMLLDMARNGQEPTADDLIMAEIDTTSDIK